MNYTYLPSSRQSLFLHLSLILFFILSARTNLSGQCNQDIILSSQAEVNAFSCQIVAGSLTINGNDITDLSALSSLEEVQGELSLVDNPLLTSLSGLENLAIISGQLVVVFNAVLPNLNGLEGLREVAGIYMDSNNQLESLSALSGLSGELGLFIAISNQNLRNVDGLENINRITETMEINSCPSITNVDGLSGLTHVTNTLSLINCPALTDISGLRNLISSDGLVILVRTGLTDLSGLEKLEVVKIHLVIEDNPSLQSINSLYSIKRLLRLTIKNNPQLFDCCGLYPVIGNFQVSNVIDISGNGGSCNSRLDIIENCRETAPIDLGLEMSLSSSNPDAYTFFTQTITLTNQGPSMATDIEVHIPKPTGVVYQGGNEFTATKGALDTWNTFNWSISRLLGGDSASISINYYKLDTNELTFYAEVAEVVGTDSDSSPGNGTPPNPNEDDEVSTTTGISTPLPDLSLSNLNAPGNGIAGQVVNFTFDLNNTGTVEVQGAFTIGAYLSDDNTLSNDDLLAGTIPTGNTPKGTLADIPGAIGVPGNLSPGIYYLILVADIDQEIIEQNESNNQLIVPIAINSVPVLCTGDLEFNTQAELDAFGGCEIIDGDLIIDGFNNVNGNIVDLTPLISLKEVTGFIVIQNTRLTSLEGLNNLEKTGSMVLYTNTRLEDIHALIHLKGQVNTFVFIRNIKVESVKSLSGIRGDSMQTMIFTDNPGLKNLDGLEGVTRIRTLDITVNRNLEDIDGLRNLRQVDGSITFVGPSRINSMRGFSSLESVGQDLILVEFSMLEDLEGLNNLKTIGGNLVVFRNNRLKNLNALSQLESLSRLTISENDSLSNCCSLFPLLESGVITQQITIENNPAFCSSEQDILANCPISSGDIDLELSLTADPVNPVAFSFFTTTATLINKGPMPATGIRVALPAPAGTVYQGGNEFEASQGSFRFWRQQDWLVGELGAGDTATITINYYLLTNAPVTFYGQVSAANEEDVDSTPGNGLCCTANEDDEADTSINLSSAPDLSLSNYNGPDSGMPGDTLSFNFDLNNLGNQVAIGSYTISFFLSVDNLISGDDYAVGGINTGNTPIGSISDVFAAMSIPATIPGGAYRLILAADFGAEIAESEESNNQLDVPFTIIGTTTNRQSNPAAFNLTINQLQEIVVERSYPNPAEDFFVLDFSARVAGDLPLVVYDALGAAVKRKTLKLEKGKNQVVMDIRNWQAGMYYLRFEIPYRHEALRFVKVRR